jgi:hypothetical protein
MVITPVEFKVISDEELFKRVIQNELTRRDEADTRDE